MLNIRTVILPVALVIILMVAVPLVTARTEIVSDPSSNPASGLEAQEGSANIIDTYRARSYRSNYGERQVPIASYRSPLDVCYDVPLKDANSCRNASQASIPLYRSPLEVCYDVSLSEAAACRLSEQARSNRGSTDVTDPVVLSQLARVRKATARYHDVNVAIADGYLPTDACDESPDGGMGFHYFNPALGMDAAVILTTPEVLMYESVGGELRLVGVEYFVGIGAPDAPVPNPAPPAPILFGRAFDGPMPGHIPGMPPHYDLHVWVWQPNPNGMFVAWNPSVTCP